MKGEVFNRDGITDGFLAAAGCQHVGSDECVRCYGFRAEGTAIPFRSLGGQPITDKGKPFARVRLYDATENQKYHQRSGSGTHVYVPHNFRELPRESTLFITEGEFKSLSLAEAGFAAVGLCGICGAMRTTDGEAKLHPELVEVLEFHKPARVAFIGDSDTVLNSDFAREVSKLRAALFDTKRLSFIQELRVAVCPLDGPKGIDDVRDAMEERFNGWFESLIEAAFVCPAKASAVEVFCALLRPETKRVGKALKGDGVDAHRYKVKLLHSAAKLQHEAGAMLRLKPILSKLLNVKESSVATLIRDAGKPQAGGSPTKKPAAELPGQALDLRPVEPWPGAVEGAATLDEIAGVFRRYVALPDGAADALALWVAHAHALEAFNHSPRLNIQSPEKRCGKTVLCDVVATLVPKPLPSENLSTPVLFRVTEKYQPTLIADEYDSWIHNNEDLRGLLNAGHKRGGQALRCVGDDFEPRAFRVFAPVVLAGIGNLPGTLYDRSVVVKLVRAKPGELAARFDSQRTSREAELCRKLARWTADHFERLKDCDARLPETAFNRLADNWRPLFAIAEVAGGDWPQRAAAAFAKLTSADDLDAQGIGTMLLADIAELFGTAGADKLSSVHIVDRLKAIEGREWAEWGRARKPISTNQLAKQLRRFEILPRTIKLADGDTLKLDGKETAKGYHAGDFQEAFARFLPSAGDSKRNPVTVPENIDDSSLSEPSPDKDGLRIENAISANQDGVGDGVTVQKPGEPETAALLL